MAEGGDYPPIGTSQKRLTIIVAVLGLLGCLALGLIWWDSVENLTGYTTKKNSITVCVSSVHYQPGPFLKLDGYRRGSVEMYDLGDWPLFTRPVFSSRYTRIPIYLLILTYLASLLLIWLILMNRLARRHFKKTTSISTQN